MRISCVSSASRLLAGRALASLVIACLLAVALGVPEAEARRKRNRVAAAPYSPPYASIVYDVNSGRVLQATNADAARHPASVTKVMTLYMLFEQIESGRFRLNTELPVSREAASQAPSKLGLRPGETIQVEDAIKALVTKSANDVAVVVAEAIGGDEDRFAAMMTRKARAIGMSRSTFRNASGLPNPGQITTARDLVTLGKAIQDRFPRYYGYFGTRTFNYDGASYRNHNRLLGQVEGVDGIKTGFTRASGFNLLTSAKADGRHLITVVLGGRSARIRDQQVASLIENHMDRAYAGRRMSAKTTEVAARDETDEEEEDGNAAARKAKPGTGPAYLPAPRVAAAPVPPAAVQPQATAQVQTPQPAPQAIAALPPSRPRPAVIAEPPARPIDESPSLNRVRPLALSSSGSTNIVQTATTPLALVGNPSRPQPMRWVAGPQAAEPPALRRAPGEERLVPPGNVRYTNSTGESAKVEENQPLPQTKLAEIAAPKAEERLPSMASRAQIAAVTPPPAPVAAPRAPEPVRVAAVTPKAEAEKPAGAKPATPPRSGWVIQLAAAESDAKARVILGDAKSKTGALLKSAEPFTESVTKGSATLWRARYAGFDAGEAEQACKALKRAGFNCIAQKL